MHTFPREIHQDIKNTWERIGIFKCNKEKRTPLDDFYVEGLKLIKVKKAYLASLLIFQDEKQTNE